MWSAYCDCAMGRWILRQHREKFPGGASGMPTLEDVAMGRTVWLLDPPALGRLTERIEQDQGAGKTVRQILEALREHFKK